MLTLPNKQANQYTSSRQLINGDDINNLVSQLNSNEVGITARAGGGQANAYQLKTATNELTTVATNADSVKLPKGIPGLEVWVQNAGAANAQVFVYNTGTINGTDGSAIGVALNSGSVAVYKCMKVTAAGVETWVSK